MPDAELIRAQAAYADQLLKYADAVTGVAFLQSLAFCYKLSEDSFAEKIIQFRTVIVPPVIWATSFYVFAVVMLYAGSYSIPSHDDFQLRLFKTIVEAGRIVVVLVSGCITYWAFAFTHKTRREAQLQSSTAQSTGTPL